jgi:hypothetical protein
MADFEERRGRPRLMPDEDLRLSLSVLLEVELIDLSTSGLMFSSEVELTIGHRLQVVTLLGGEPFSAWVDIRRAERESPLSPEARRCRYGAAFVAIEEKSQRNLRRFLSQGSLSA